MGTKYSTVTVSGYNSSSPADDGSQTAANQVKWSTIKTKLGDPLNTAIAAIDGKLVTALDFGSRQVTSADTTVAADHMKTVEIAPSVSTSITVSLGDAATMAAGYIVTVKNSSANAQTVGRITVGDKIDGVAANFTLPPKGAMTFKVANTASEGYLVIGQSGGFVTGETDPTKVLRFETDGFTTGTTRVVTFPDANLTIPAVTAKGDLVAASGSGVLVRVAVSATDGDLLIADSSAAGGVSYRTKITRGTALPTTTGTTATFTGIPAWVKKILIAIMGVSVNGTSNFLIQIGPSGGIETTVYESSCEAAGTGASSTAGFIFTNIGAASVHTGLITLVNIDGNSWVSSGVVRPAGTSTSGVGTGWKTLAGTLTQLRLTTVSGDTFDAGTMNIFYE